MRHLDILRYHPRGTHISDDPVEIFRSLADIPFGERHYDVLYCSGFTESFDPYSVEDDFLSRLIDDGTLPVQTDTEILYALPCWRNDPYLTVINPAHTLRSILDEADFAYIEHIVRLKESIDGISLKGYFNADVINQTMRPGMRGLVIIPSYISLDYELSSDIAIYPLRHEIRRA